MVNVKSSRDCKIANKEFSYTFTHNIVQSVNEEHLDVLLNTGLVETVVKTTKTKEDIE